MKVLFLDIDGVLNSVAYSQTVVRQSLIADPNTLDPKAGKLLGDWIRKFPDLVVVISSTWRKMCPLPELKEILANIGIPADRVIEYTPVIHNVVRGEEIKAWFQGQMFKSNFPVTSIAIVDDDADMGDLLPFLVQTNVEVGLTAADLTKVEAVFNLALPKNC